MNEINNFQEVRKDGKIINEQMTLDRVIELGWIPDIVTILRWNYNDKTIELIYPDGVLAELLLSRDGVALQINHDKSLRIINANGTERFRVPNIQMINGKPTSGEFQWFEVARSGSPNHFGAAFLDRASGSLYVIEIDALTGATLDLRPTR